MVTSVLDTLRCFIGEYPLFGILEQMKVKRTDDVPGGYAFFGDQMREVIGCAPGAAVCMPVFQEQFVLFGQLPLEKSDHISDTYAPDWFEDFRAWVDRECICGRAPVFGDDPDVDRVIIDNLGIYHPKTAEGAYLGTTWIMARVKVQYAIKFEGAVLE